MYNINPAVLEMRKLTQKEKKAYVILLKRRVTRTMHNVQMIHSKHTPKYVLVLVCVYAGESFYFVGADKWDIKRT